jgi:hypothetical protein
MTNEKQDELDRVLDAALAKYAVVAPRAGLEERLLSSLRAEQARVPDRAWWHWIVAGALAAVIVAVMLVAWRSGRPQAPVIADHPSTPAPSVPPSGAQIASNSGAIRKSPLRRSSPKVEIAAVPKLDQFPSPQPLSQQERILVNYVEQYPERSVLLARARSEALRQDQLEEMKALPSSGWAMDSDDRNNDTTQR